MSLPCEPIGNTMVSIAVKMRVMSTGNLPLRWEDLIQWRDRLEDTPVKVFERVKVSEK